MNNKELKKILKMLKKAKMNHKLITLDDGSHILEINEPSKGYNGLALFFK